MAPIITTAKIVSNTRADRNLVIEAFKRIIEYSECNEPDVLRYVVTVPIDDYDNGTDLYMIEEYASTEANEAHVNTPPVQDLIKLFTDGNVLIYPPEVHTHAIAFNKPLTSVPALSSNPAIVLAYFAYKTGTLKHALHGGWDEVIRYVTENEEPTLGYTIMADEQKEVVRTVEVYTDWSFVENVHLKGKEIAENKHENGLDRVGSGAVKVKAIAGFLGRSK